MGIHRPKTGNALICWILQVLPGGQLARKALKFKGKLGPEEMLRIGHDESNDLNSQS
jgi:hypothetical protein